MNSFIDHFVLSITEIGKYICPFNDFFKVQHVFAGLISNELVSVQPMSLPTDLLFYLNYTYVSKNNFINYFRLNKIGLGIEKNMLYWHEKLVATLKIPREFLGYDRK